VLALAGETLVDLVLEGENPLRFAGALGGVGAGRESLRALAREDLEAALRGAVALSALACTVRGAGLPEEGLRAWKGRFLGD
jgi:sugar/nucleoside kinase (ribokinase family)